MESPILNYESLFDYLNSSSSNWSGKDALVIRRKIKLESIRYEQITGLLNKFDNWFTKNNIPVHTKVLFWGTNCSEYSLALLACMSLGRTAVPIDWKTSEDTIKNIIKKTNPTHAFISKYFKKDFISQENIQVHTTEDLFDEVMNTAEITISESLLKIYREPENIVEIVFTSGTTGVPKGVVMKQKNIIENMKAIAKGLPDLKDSRTISILPLSHMLEQIAGLLLPIGYGTTINYIPRINSFKLLCAFRDYQPTHLVFVPQMLKMFWQKIEDKAVQDGVYKKLQLALKLVPFMPNFFRRIVFSNIHKVFGGQLRFIACGGAPLDRNTATNWLNIGIPILEGYGATEVTAVATFNNINNPILGSVGKALPGVTLQIDNTGEIYINSLSLSAGYYEDEARTKEFFSTAGYKTGDIGRLDAKGNLYIIGRDVFKIVLANGEKVFVEDIESKIMQHPLVKETCVVGRKVASGDEIFVYLIMKNWDDNHKVKSVIDQINLRLESKQQILSYEIWQGDDFPRTSTLKIDRKSVYEVVNNKLNISDVTLSKISSSFAIQDIVDVLAKVSGINKEKILDSDKLAGDLNIDSLTRVEIVALAEEYLGISLDETLITARTSVADLKHLVQISETSRAIELPQWQFTALGELLHYLLVSYLLIPLHKLIINITYSKNVTTRIEPGSLVIFNHPGILDGVCVLRLLFLQNSFKQVTNAASNFWTNNSIFARPLELFVGGIPLYETGSKLLQVLQKDSDLMKRGYNLLFAPQGGLQMSETEDPFKIGIGYIAQQLDCSVYIVKISGYREIWPVPKKGFENCSLLDFLPNKRGSVTVDVSEKIHPDWKIMTPIQITNLLEEKYKEL